MDNPFLGDAEWGGDVDRGRSLAVTGWRCEVCGAELGIETPFPWRCPNATETDRRHVLGIVSRPGPPASNGFRQTFIEHDHDLAWAAFAAAHGMTMLARHALVVELDDRIHDVARARFTATPLARSDELSSELGFTSEGGVWVKDETGGVAGSQKARHLLSILLHLRAAEELGLLVERPPLAIASCGNAAVAAAMLAEAADWPLDVYVPTWMTDGFGRLLDRHGASVHRCERRSDDPLGDPAMLRFREAVADGAIPFTVQGPENALCLDGGRTIGWEIAAQLGRDGVDRPDRTYVQVGGGAFATCLGRGLMHGVGPTRLDAVQAAGCAPLARAWTRAVGRSDPGAAWEELMTPWEAPESIADGILDDETYDWLGVVDVMRRGGGRPVVVSEGDLVAAHELAHRAGFDASPTGSAGLAGLIADRSSLSAHERVVLVMSGVTR